MKKNKNNINFKKIALLSAAILTSASSFAISTGGAVAAGLGAATAVTLIGVGIHKHRKHKRERYGDDYKATRQKNTKHSSTEAKKESNQYVSKKSIRSQKHELKSKIHNHKKSLKKHKTALKDLNKQDLGTTPKAEEHRSLINKLENMIINLENELRSL